MTPDSSLSQTQAQAVEFLERCLHEMEPLAALVGGAGSGKTVALNALLARRDVTSLRVIRVNNFVAGPLSLHRVLASAFGIMDAGDLSAEALEPVLRHTLVEAGRSGPPVLAVDDAQSLLPETLRYLCLLGGLREAGRPLIQVLLVGRPGFAARQSMPRQFALEALSPDDARRLVLNKFKAAGVAAPDDVVQDIVRSGQGNLRKLDGHLTAGIEEARSESRSLRTTRRGTIRMETGNTRPVRRSGKASWVMFPVLLVVGAAALAGAYHGGMLNGHHDGVVSTVATAPPHPNAAAQPSGRPIAGFPAVNPPAVAPAKPTAGPTPLPVAIPAPAAAPAAADQVQAEAPRPQAPALHDAPLQTRTAASAQPAAAPPAAAQPATAPPAAAPPATAQPATASPAAGPSSPTQPEGAPAPIAPPASAPAQTHFRVYNISSCHQGICPRWSITDLDQQQHFVAAFNPATLHLDHDVLQKLREGTLDLLVRGSVVRGAGGRTLVADALQAVVPHHGRQHTPSSSGSEPIELAPPQLQSPPPGFLPVPPPPQ